MIATRSSMKKKFGPLLHFTSLHSFFFSASHLPLLSAKSTAAPSTSEAEAANDEDPEEEESEDDEHKDWTVAQKKYYAIFLLLFGTGLSAVLRSAVNVCVVCSKCRYCDAV